MDPETYEVRADGALLACEPADVLAMPALLPLLMRRVAHVATAGRWPAAAARDSVTLAWDDRHRRRVRLVSDGGAPFLLDLERATALGDGDGLALDDGGWVAVVAAPEPVAESAPPTRAPLPGLPGTSATATSRRRFSTAACGFATTG